VRVKLSGGSTLELESAYVATDTLHGQAKEYSRDSYGDVTMSEVTIPIVEIEKLELRDDSLRVTTGEVIFYTGILVVVVLILSAIQSIE
jgi:hypothetical protein